LQSYPRHNTVAMELLEESAIGYASRFENGRSMSTRIELLLHEVFEEVKLQFSGGRLLIELLSLQELRAKFADYMEVEVDWGDHG
jgi:hypothetical protein